MSKEIGMKEINKNQVIIKFNCYYDPKTKGAIS